MKFLAKPELPLKRCEHCDAWNPGEKAFCQKCGEIIDLNYRKEMAELEKKQSKGTMLFNWYKVPGAKNSILLFLWEKFVQSGQAILMGIISLITLLLLLLPG